MRYNKFRLTENSVGKLQKQICHKFVPIKIVEETVQDIPLHYSRVGVRPEIMNPTLLDKMYAPVKSDIPQRFAEFLDLAVSRSKQWIKSRDRDIFKEYLYTEKTIKELAIHFEVSTGLIDQTIKKIKRLAYVHFAEDFDIQIIPDEWKSVYVPIEITDDCTTFIPGKSYRS